MEIFNREQIRFTGLDPEQRGGGLALGAVTVATGVIRDTKGAAGVAFINVTTEGRGATVKDIANDFEMVKREAMVAKEVIAKETKNVSKFKIRFVRIRVVSDNHNWPQRGESTIEYLQ